MQPDVANKHVGLLALVCLLPQLRKHLIQRGPIGPYTSCVVAEAYTLRGSGSPTELYICVVVEGDESPEASTSSSISPLSDSMVVALFGRRSGAE